MDEAQESCGYPDPAYPALIQMILERIRGNLFEYICAPETRQEKKKRMSADLQMLSAPACYGHAHPRGEPGRAGCRELESLPWYESLIDEAMETIDAGEGDAVIASLTQGDLFRAEQALCREVTAGAGGEDDGSVPDGVRETFQENLRTICTLVEILAAVSVLFPGVFVSLGLPATLTRSLVAVQEIRKVHPGLQIAWNRREEIILIAGTMASYAEGLHQNARETMTRLSGDDRMQSLTLIDETGRSSGIFSPLLPPPAYPPLPDEDQGGDESAVPSPVTGREGIPEDAVTEMMERISRLIGTVSAPVTDTVRGAAGPGPDLISLGTENIMQMRERISLAGERIGSDLGKTIQGLSERINPLKGVNGGTGSSGPDSAGTKKQEKDQDQPVSTLRTALAELQDGVSRLSAEIETAIPGPEGDPGFQEIREIITSLREELNRIAEMIGYLQAVTKESDHRHER